MVSGITVCYDHFYEFEDQERKMHPTSLILHIGEDFDWNAQTVYVSLETPFQRQHMEDFSEYEMGISITLGDLVRRTDSTSEFGIHLPHVKKRVAVILAEHPDFEFEYSGVSILSVRVDDLELLLCMDLQPKYRWEVTS